MGITLWQSLSDRAARMARDERAGCAEHFMMAPDLRQAIEHVLGGGDPQ